MKTKSFVSSWLVLLLLHSQALNAQQFSLGSYSIVAGGGASAGGSFQVTGSIGQPDAGHSAGGSFAVEGGFWAIAVVVQSPGLPSLRIAVTDANTILLAWSAASAGFALQQNSDLGALNWSNVTNAPTVMGDENQVILPLSPGNRFFRLKYP